MKHFLKPGLWGFGTVATLAFGLAIACSPSAPATSEGTSTTGEGTAPKKEITVGIVFDKGGRGDKSFNDSAYRGIERAEKEFGIKVNAVDSRTDADYETNITSQAERGADLVIAVGFGMLTAANQVAPQFPDTKFALIDAVAEPSNVRSILFKEHEGSFLVGYIAGRTSKTKKVGFVGGKPGDLITKFYAGFVAGVKEAGTGTEVLPPKYTQDWDNVDVAKAAANVLYGQGADIIYHAAGRAGLGVFEAAKEQNKYAIGVDSDQDDIAPGRIVTSMVKRVDEAVYQTIKDVVEGKFSGGTKVYDLASGGVGTTDFRNAKELVTDAIKADLDKVAERIKSGEIVVPEK